MKPWNILATIVALWLLAPAPQVHASQGLMRCESTGYRYNFCNANTQGRVVLLRELSTGNLCRQGRGWGYDGNGIWVDHGCRGEFSYGRDDGGGSWDRDGRLTCESIGYRYRYCNANTRGRVNLIRELSTGNLCRQGSGWGFDNGGIWVDRGCRGEFRYGQDDSRNNNAAIAAGIVGAFALGAAINSSQNAAPSPPPPPPPPAYSVPATPAPGWAVGAFQAWDPDQHDTVQLTVRGSGEVLLRDGAGAIVNQGALRDGMVWWRNGKQSWLAREGPGVMLGDVDTGRHFYFRRSS